MLPPKPAEPSAQPPVSFLRENSNAAFLRTDFDKQLKRAQTAWLKEMETLRTPLVAFSSRLCLCSRSDTSRIAAFSPIENPCFAK